MGLKHLNEEQLNSLLKFEQLVDHGCQVRLHDVVDAQGAPDRVALFLVPSGDGAICETVQTPAKAWIRQGLQNVPLSDAARDRLKRDRRVVDFERAACTRFDAGNRRRRALGIQAATSPRVPTIGRTRSCFIRSAPSREKANRRPGPMRVHFLLSQPQRVLSHAHLRLLRFEAPIGRIDDDLRRPSTRVSAIQSPADWRAFAPSWPSLHFSAVPAARSRWRPLMNPIS